VLLLSLLLAGAFPSPQVWFVRDRALHVVSVDKHVDHVVESRGAVSPVSISADGRFTSAGGLLTTGKRLSTATVAWSREGATAAYQTASGAVVLWRPHARPRVILSAAWGATSLAWGPGGRLALGRSVCKAPCGIPRHQEVWVWRAGRLARVAGALSGVQRPIVRGFDSQGRVLWWSDLEASASIAADGLPLYADRRKIATTLPYADYVASCSTGLVVAAGTDRYATHGKGLLLNGRDLSRDATRSWVEPACRGDQVVAAASRNTVPDRIGNEHRSIWQLLPNRRQLTHPPAGATDEDPQVLADGSIVFVRTRKRVTRLHLYGRGTLMLLREGKLTRLADVGRTDNYYGHYDWARQIAVWP
jgi:hypothetical protein